MEGDQFSQMIARGEYHRVIDLLSQPNDTRAITFSQLSRVFELLGKFERALELANQGLNNSLTNTDRFISSISYAYAQWRLFNFSQALTQLDRVTHFQMNDSWKGSYFNIKGLIFWKQDALGEAEINFKLGLNLRKKAGDQNKIAYSINNLGNNFLKLKDYEKAEEYYLKALNLREILGHQPALAASHNSLGRLFDARGEFEVAQKWHKKSLQGWKKVGNEQFIAKSYRFLAINASLRDQLDQSSAYFDQSDLLFSSIPNKTDLGVNKDLRKKYL